MPQPRPAVKDRLPLPVRRVGSRAIALPAALPHRQPQPVQAAAVQARPHLQKRLTVRGAQLLYVGLTPVAELVRLVHDGD